MDCICGYSGRSCAFRNQGAHRLRPLLGSTELRPVYEQETLQKHLNALLEFADCACYKYFVAHPVMVAATQGDGLSKESIIALAKKFEAASFRMQELSAEMGGFKIGSSHIGSTKLSVTSVLIWVFFEQGRAAELISMFQKDLKSHSWATKTWVLPWVIDVPGKKVAEHSGLPFMKGMLSRDFLQKELFSH
jgi:hypothetical protein